MEMTKNEVNVEVKEMMKETKELVGLSDIEKELLSLGYAVTDISAGPGGGSVVTYTKETMFLDLYEGLFVKNASFFSLLRLAEDSLSASGRFHLSEYNFKGHYTSQVVRSESGEVMVSHRYTYYFFTDSPWGFSVSLEVSGELDAPMPKGNPVTCEVRPVIYLGPVPVRKGWKRDVEELVSKISSFYAVRNIKLHTSFPEADVYLILEKTRVVCCREKKTTSTRYLGKAGEVFYIPSHEWSDDEDYEEGHDEDYDSEDEEYDDEDSDFEEEDLDEDEEDE
jgi:hypothetical protein